MSVSIDSILSHISAQFAADFLRYKISLPLPLFHYNCFPTSVYNTTFILRGCRSTCHSRRPEPISPLGNTAGGHLGAARGPLLPPQVMPRVAPLDLYLKMSEQSLWTRRLQSVTIVLILQRGLVFSRSIFANLTPEHNGSGW